MFRKCFTLRNWRFQIELMRKVPNDPKKKKSFDAHRNKNTRTQNLSMLLFQQTITQNFVRWLSIGFCFGFFGGRFWNIYDIDFKVRILTSNVFVNMYKGTNNVQYTHSHCRSKCSWMAAEIVIIKFSFHVNWIYWILFEKKAGNKRNLFQKWCSNQSSKTVVSMANRWIEQM